MPIKIPVYQQQVAPTLETSTGSLPVIAPDTSAIGRGLEAVSEGATRLGNVVQHQQMQDAQALVSRKIGDDKVKWLQYMQDAKDNAQPGAPDFTPGLMTKFDDYANESLQTMPNGPAKRFYSMQLTQFRTSLAENAVTWQAAQHRAYNIDQYTQGNDAAARAIAMDPSQYGESRASQLALINASSLDAQTKARLTDSFKDMASTAAGMRMVTDNPQQAYTALTQKPDQPLPQGYEWIGDLPPQKLTVLQNHARTLVLQQQNAADREAQARESAATTAFNAAFDVSSKGQYLSPPAVQDLLTAAKGTSVEKDAQALVEMQGHTAGFASQSLTGQAAELERMRAASATPSIGVNPVESKVLAQYEQIHTAAVDAYKKNPWQAAQAYGVTQNAPTANIGSVDDALAVVKSRAAAQPVVETAAGRKISPFQPDEAAQFARVLDALPIDQRSTAVSQIGASLGDPTRAADFAKQISDTHRPLYLELMAGSINARTQGGQPVAQLIAEGEQAIRDKAVKLDDTAQNGLRAQLSKLIRGTFASGTQDQDAIDSAYYIAVRNAARVGTLGDSEVKAAAATATGGLTTFNGKSTAMPFGWKEDEFERSIKQVAPNDLITPVTGGSVRVGKTTMPIDAFVKSIPSAQVVRVSHDGNYAVVAGTGYATNAAGDPIIFRLKYQK